MLSTSAYCCALSHVQGYVGGMALHKHHTYYSVGFLKVLAFITIWLLSSFLALARSTSVPAWSNYWIYFSSSQHWSNISTFIGHSVEWPRKRIHHAATHLSGPLFVLVGGVDQYAHTLKDMWLCDTTTKLWKNVLFLVTVLCVQYKRTNTKSTITLLGLYKSQVTQHSCIYSVQNYLYSVSMT